jgi:hypothetical protein
MVKSGAARIVTTPKRNGMRVCALRMPARVATTLIPIGIGGGPFGRYVDGAGARRRQPGPAPW